MIALSGHFHATTVWTARAAWELIFRALFVALLGNTFWNVAMCRGNITLVSLAAYFTLLIAILINGFYLNTCIGLNLWMAAALVVAGAASVQGLHRGTRALTAMKLQCCPTNRIVRTGSSRPAQA